MHKKFYFLKRLAALKGLRCDENFRVRAYVLTLASGVDMMQYPHSNVIS